MKGCSLGTVRFVFSLQGRLQKRCKAKFRAVILLLSIERAKSKSNKIISAKHEQDV